MIDNFLFCINYKCGYHNQYLDIKKKFIKVYIYFLTYP